ncbi:MAG: hypothetical protein IKV85_01500 [Ruminococcus sp.]|nr:hypothetical protein [Ruminococcus sp.]
MIYWLDYRTKDGAEGSLQSCVSFVYEKEAYTPYTSLKAVVYGDDLPDDITEVKMNIDGYHIHHGFVDSYRVTRQNGINQGILASRGFTALLTENQLPPGMYTDMTLDRLFSDYIAFPYIEHESNTQSSYIYVNKGASIWDSIANLSYKIAEVYPYVADSNTVMISMPDMPRKIICDKENMYSCGTEIMTRRMVSSYNMADISGEYGAFSAVSEEAAARNIIRHRHFELDMRFLNNPDMACQYRIMMSERGYKRHFFTFVGFQGQDLNDIAVIDEQDERRINSVKVKGGRNGVFTEISVYDTT